MMANVTEQPLPEKTAALLQGAGGDALKLLKLDEAADPKSIISAIDAFVDAWQEGKRPPKDQIDPEDAPYAFGTLWGQQLVRQFKWEWGLITFHDHGNSKAPGVLSPDRVLAVYPIHFLMGCFQNKDVDCTVALSFNLLIAGEDSKLKATLKQQKYFNLMDGVRRIVPKR